MVQFCCTFNQSSRCATRMNHPNTFIFQVMLSFILPFGSYQVIACFLCIFIYPQYTNTVFFIPAKITPNCILWKFYWKCQLHMTWHSYLCFMPCWSIEISGELQDPHLLHCFVICALAQQKEFHLVCWCPLLVLLAIDIQLNISWGPHLWLKIAILVLSKCWVLYIAAVLCGVDISCWI